MWRNLAASALLATLLLGLTTGTVRAQKGGSRSYSSGGGRSYSSPSGKSYGSGGGSASRPSVSGKSYGSGAPAASPSGGRSYSSGGKTNPAPPASPSGKTYSSGGPSTPPPKTSPAAPVSRSGKSYASGASPPVAMPTPPPGSGSYSGKSYQPPPNRTSTKGYDAAAAAARQKEASREAYTRGNAPQPTYTDPKGNVRPIDPKDRRVEELRAQLDEQKRINRAQRQQPYFQPYVSRPVVVYQDPYSSLFWYWLLDQSIETQARWVYHHQRVMDQARYQALVAQKPLVAAQVQQLETQNVPRDPAYSPPGLPPDLMYTDSYVNAAYNPEPAPATASPVLAVPQPAGEFFLDGLRVLLYALAILAVLTFLIWLVFFKRWGGTPG